MAFNKESLEVTVMNLVVNSGNARSLAMEAIRFAKDGQIEAAKKQLSQAREEINTAHHFQTELAMAEAGGEQIPMSLIMCHGQDHLMTAMVVIDLADEFINLYEKLQSREGEKL